MSATCRRLRNQLTTTAEARRRASRPIAAALIGALLFLGGCGDRATSPSSAGEAPTSIPPTPSQPLSAPLVVPTPKPSPAPTTSLANPLEALATLVPAVPAISGILGNATPPPGSPVPTRTPFATPLPGTGADAPERAVQLAYEAVALGDEPSLRRVTDPEVRGNPLPAFEMLGRGDRKLTLIGMRYQTIENTGQQAIVRVTGKVGNIPLLGEHNVDEKEQTRLIGSAWYLTRLTEGIAPRR